MLDAIAIADRLSHQGDDLKVTAQLVLFEYVFILCGLLEYTTGLGYSN